MIPFWFHFCVYLALFCGNAFFWHRRGWYDAFNYIDKRLKEKENENYRG